MRLLAAEPANARSLVIWTDKVAPLFHMELSGRCAWGPSRGITHSNVLMCQSITALNFAVQFAGEDNG
jgi:hypothetical protein